MKTIAKVIYSAICLGLAAIVIVLSYNYLYPPKVVIRDSIVNSSLRGDTFRDGSIYDLKADRVRQVALPNPRGGVEANSIRYFFRIPMTELQFDDFVKDSKRNSDLEVTLLPKLSIPDVDNTPPWFPKVCPENFIGHASGAHEPRSYIFHSEIGFYCFYTY